MTQRSGVFGRDYAAAYDDLYQDKDYVAECDLIERVFETYGQGPTRRVLDLGCGTGGHAVILAKRGYDVVGVDRSPEMLERARALGSSARFATSGMGRRCSLSGHPNASKSSSRRTAS